MSITEVSLKSGKKSYLVRVKNINKSFKVREHAKAYERELLRANERGEIDQLDRITQGTKVSEVIEEFKLKKLPTLARGGVDKLALLDRISEEFGNSTVAALRGPLINRWTDRLTAAGLSGHTVNHHLNCLSSLVDFSRRRMGVHVPENPVRLVDRPQVSRARDRRLRDGEFEYLSKAANDPTAAIGLPQILILAVETSMRLGELISLRWDLIDLKRQTAHLPNTKNGESRTIALSIAALAALNGLPRRLDGRVFGWAAIDSFQKPWQRCVRRAKAYYERDYGQNKSEGFLVDFRFHDLRHEATSRLFEKGLGVMDVASMTGHKSFSMLKRYTHIDASRLAQKLG